MSLLYTVLAFLLALGPLIIIHELGHYLVARLCGVKVLRFSIGMGRIVWSRRFGRDQTEWAVSLLPLGGYVKFLDARDPATAPKDAAEEAREFTRQSVWKRIAIVAAGPIANFILAIVVMAGLYMHGKEEPGTRLRAPAPESVAYAAGMRGGDAVVAIDGDPVVSWEELRWELVRAAVDKRDAELDVRRPGGGSYVAVLPAAKMSALDADGDVTGALGLDLWRSQATIDKVLPDGAGARAGMRPGDVVQSVDGRPMVDGVDFVKAVQAAPGRTLQVEVRRGGQSLVLALVPEHDAQSKRGRAGVMVAQAPEMVVVRAGPFEALARGAARTWETSAMTVKMIGRMIVGEASLKNVTGPLTIADVAGQAARSGLETFLGLIAFISISLGVMNLLPIPVLDGGHLLYYSLEVLTGRPVSARVGEIAQRAGVGLLFMLMALAFFNDLVRLF